MDELLKKLAALDNTTLTVYTLLDPNYKKPRKPRAKRLKPATAEPIEPPAKPLKSPESLCYFDQWSRQFSSVCEADAQLSKMTAEELEELGYSETDSDSETEGHFNIEDYDIGSEIRSEWRETFYRTDRCTENLPNRVTTRYTDLFNQLALKNIFSANLRSCPDPTVQRKLDKFSPLITAKCFIEFYNGVKDHLKNNLNMTESILYEMRSIWSRARPYRSLSDLSSDFRRLRKLKTRHPSCTIQDIQEGYYFPNDFPEFLGNGDVPVELVVEASKRIGADKYGPTNNFADIIDETNLSEPEPEPELISTTAKIVTSDTVATIDNSEPQQDPTLSQPPSTPVTTENLTKQDISKLHRAIKKALKNKLSK